MNTSIGKTREWLRTNAGVLAIGGVAVVVRLVYAWIALPWASARLGYGATPGADEYCHIAESLMAGAGYRFRPDFGETMFRLPGYPLFLCGIWWLFGPRLWVVQIFQALLSAGTSILTFHVGKRYFSPTVGFLAGMAFALWPLDWVSSARYSQETLYIFLLSLSLVIVLALAKRPCLRGGAVLGLVLGIASLSREVGIYLAFALAAGVPLLPIAAGRRIKCFLMTGTALLVMVLVMSPWLARGYWMTGSLVVPTTADGLVLYMDVQLSEHPDYKGDLRDHWNKVIYPAAYKTMAANGIIANDGGDFQLTYWWTFMSIEDEMRARKILRDEAMVEIHNHPAGFLRTVFGNVLGFWFRGQSETMSWVAKALFVPLLLLGAIGLVAAARSGQTTAWLLLLVIVCLNLVCAPSITVVRYTLPATPALLLLAACGAVRVLPGRLSRPRTSANGANASSMLPANPDSHSRRTAP